MGAGLLRLIQLKNKQGAWCLGFVSERTAR
jgi:hypothetical protein